MKKRNLKTLKLEKKLISSLDLKKQDSVKGGGNSGYYNSRCCYQH
ncbi:hypothetical protein IMCC3317_40120 [Kordia antarctica]|uniref:Uncharacterized protein n=1 Tax=Kordia antarctica TaxID=1218801 RepID=A0A7L4ZPG2_9FLAO|nr:hypothetical protein [Kordia antarctica]QHI38618.1 hypothetical protein IMCC3317_40120 [Kordia antarctica]